MNLATSDLRKLETIREATLSSLEQLIDVTKPVAILDVPNYTNVGDHMIYAGTRDYLKRLGVSVRYISDRRRFDGDVLRLRMPAGTILINGGGNFGDIWTASQEFREDLAQRFPDYPIVQLSQSIYYRDPSRALSANSILSSYPNFTVLIRETDSMNRADQLIPDVRRVYVPDMALGWTPTGHAKQRPDKRGMLVLAREDEEGITGLASKLEHQLSESDHIRDWKLDRLGRAKWYFAQIPGEINRHIRSSYLRTLLYPLAERGHELVVRTHTELGLELYSRPRMVVTDRLHAHILALLLGLPNVALDNEYGKVGAIFRDYTHQFSTSRFAENYDELEEVLKLWRLNQAN